MLIQRDCKHYFKVPFMVNARFAMVLLKSWLIKFELDIHVFVSFKLFNFISGFTTKVKLSKLSSQKNYVIFEFFDQIQASRVLFELGTLNYSYHPFNGFKITWMRVPLFILNPFLNSKIILFLKSNLILSHFLITDM